MNTLNLIMNTFKYLCMLTTCFMVGFWVYKYHRNEDITLTEYKAFSSNVDAIYPELSICLTNPFLTSKFATLNTNVTKEMYLEYLKGETMLNDTGLNIDYEQVSPDLIDFVNSMSIRTRSESTEATHFCSEARNCNYINLKNNFNGYLFEGTFAKCFGIDIIRKNADDVVILSIDFMSIFADILKQIGRVYVFFNHPNQLLRDPWGPVTIWGKDNSYQKIEFFSIESMEILERRNKRNHQCAVDWMMYDHLVMKNHIEKVGCRTPYQKSDKDFPLCVTRNELKQSVVELSKFASKFLLPCQELSQLAYKHNIEDSYTSYTKGSFAVSVLFPDKKKVIRQSQAIDIHSLIGNIGGYIGLFLGKKT